MSSPSLIGILATAIVLSIMVFVHELGHFIVAKLCKVRVYVFSIGFGKRLFGYKYGDTDYRISVLPLGGYVMMAGEAAEQNLGATAPPSSSPEVAADDLTNHPRWQRVLIALAGPFANFLLAIALLTGVYMTHNETPQYVTQAVVLDYVPPGTPAAKAGFQPGDRVVKFDGVSNPTWEQFNIKVGILANQKTQAEIERNGTPMAIQFQPTSQDIFDDGFLPRVSDAPLDIEAVSPGSPAAKAGLKQGDRIVAVDGLPIHFGEVFIQYLQDTKGKPVTVTVQRGGQTVAVPLKPELSTEANSTRYRIGIALGKPPLVIERQSLGAAFRHSLETNRDGSTMIFEVLRRMFTFRMSPRSVDGPIAIMGATSSAVSMPGWTPLVGLMALISLNLGIMNLLPFPILDGGAILLLLIEGVMRRDLNTRAKERIYQGAFVVLVLAFVLIIVNDLSKFSFFHHGVQ